jgi:alcohol dehydrogenase (cytochrome c)
MYQLAGPDSRVETTPLVSDGIMFLTTPSAGIRALDAATGEELWKFDRPLPGVLSLCCGLANRGVAILDSLLYLATPDAHVIAVHARSGKVAWDVSVADPALGYSFTSAPLAVRDLVVIGNSGGDYPTRGFIDAYDARTGKRRWRFWTIPEKGQPGNETWGGDSWKAGGAAAWLTGAYDPSGDLIYWGIGNPNPDFYGDDRAGSNLYSNSVVALDGSTGKLRWSFQFTPHDEHDWDAAQFPILLDQPGDRSPNRLLWANRNGFFYVLDRRSGEFLRGAPFAHQTWAEGLDSSGHPQEKPGSRPTLQGTLMFPSAIGATNWWPPSYNPKTGMVYVPTLEQGGLYLKGVGGGVVTTEGRMGTRHEAAAPGGASVFIRALDARTGELRWEHEVFHGGSGPEPEQVGGTLTTAGGIVLGGGRDRLVALDAQSGILLWELRSGGAIYAAPMTYMVKGRQQITVAAGRTILTLGLP